MLVEIIKGRKKGYIAICTCDYCGKIIKKRYSQAKKYNHTFCNSNCSGKFKIGKLFTEERKQKIGQKAKGRYIGIKNPMFGVHRYGRENPNWNGGKIKDCRGYIKIYKPNHPNALNGRYVMEHRLVMEEFLGRYLLSKEVIHHINEIRDDNKIENLMLFTNCGEHHKYHNLMKENLCQD